MDQNGKTAAEYNWKKNCRLRWWLENGCWVKAVNKVSTPLTLSDNLLSGWRCRSKLNTCTWYWCNWRCSRCTRNAAFTTAQMRTFTKIPWLWGLCSVAINCFGSAQPAAVTPSSLPVQTRVEEVTYKSLAWECIPVNKQNKDRRNVS